VTLQIVERTRDLAVMRSLVTKGVGFSVAAAMRGSRTKGGWGLVFTAQCEIHTTEITPCIQQRLWEGKDIAMMRKMSDTMKSHGALTGIRLACSGVNGPIIYGKEVLMAVSAQPIRRFTNDPVQARAPDTSDIHDLRRWFVNAAKRSHVASVYLICFYGAHNFGIFSIFLSRATNHRTDEYGGGLENPARFVNEVIGDIRDVVGDTMGITLRVFLDESINDLGFSNAEVRDFVEMNRNLPDVWEPCAGHVGRLFRLVALQGRCGAARAGQGYSGVD